MKLFAYEHHYILRHPTSMQMRVFVSVWIKSCCTRK